MTSFAMVMLEQGVEMELPLDLPEVISILDEDVSQFVCDGYGYQLTTVSRAQLRVRWDLRVRLCELATNKLVEAPVGGITLEKLENGSVRFTIPPRAEQDYPGIGEYDPDGRYFGSLIYHMLNAMHRRELIELPGVLPTF